ncbi:hypothetical protein BHE74_00022432 [Ensete ventricosum]|nr:hypothetical protein BHE74_00022432 [Ensete ventricosum]
MVESVTALLYSLLLSARKGVREQFPLLRLTKANCRIPPRDETEGGTPQTILRPLHRRSQGHSRCASIVGHPGFHNRDQAFSPFLVACGATPPPQLYRRCCRGPTSRRRRDFSGGETRRSDAPRGEPSGLSRRRMERSEPTMPRSPNVSLNSTRIEIFLQIREKGLLKTPNPLRSRAEDRDRRCYCCFHHDYGHDTEECYDLKNQIEDLIHHGHLN